MWTNTRLAKTSAYTVANVDKGSTLALSGSSGFTATFDTPSLYDADFLMMVVNEDASIGKLVSLSGGEIFYLFPGDSCFVFNQNNVWQSNHPRRPVLKVTTTFYVSPSGSDSNSGLTAAEPFLAPQKAASLIQTLDAGQTNISVQLANGTYTSGITIAGPQVGAVEFFVTGNLADPSQVIFNLPTNTAGFQGMDGGIFTIQGITINGSDGSIGVFASRGGGVDYGNVIFGPFGAGTMHIASDNHGRAIKIGDVTLTGAASYHLVAGDQGTVTSSGVTHIPSALNFSGGFAYGSIGGIVNVGNSTYTGAGVAGTTGQQAFANAGGVVFAPSVILPGNVGPSTSTGGIVVT